MKNILKENTIKISSNLEDFYSNENIKSNSLNFQEQVKDHKKALEKSKINNNDSTFKMLANNFMSFFGYGNSLNSEKQSILNKDTNSSFRAQGIKNSQDSERNTENKAGDDKNIVRDDLFRKDDIEIQESIKVSRVLSEKDSYLSGMSINDNNKCDQLLGCASNSTSKNKICNLPVIAHISGRPVHAKYSIDGKRKIKVTQAVNDIAVDSSKSNENNSIPNSNFNSVLVTSPSLQFKQLPVTVSNYKQPVVYNTPLIPQRVMPQTNNTIYQPVYIQNQVETNNILGFVGGHIRQRTLYTQDHYNSFYNSNVKESMNSFSNMNNPMNIRVGGTLNGQYIGFGTPLVNYRSMSHVPNQQMILRGNSLNNVEGDIGVSEVNAATRLQSSNEIIVDSSIHSRNITEIDSATAINNTNHFNSHLNLQVPIKNEIKKDEDYFKKQNSNTKSNTKIESSNGQVSSLTTTASSDNGSSTTNNGNKKNRNLRIKNTQTNTNSVKELINKIEEKSQKARDLGSKGFISQASPVVNYRSTLDYLVTPMVRYRDIGGNLKVRTVPPQLSSNDSCKFDKKDNTLKNSVDIGTGYLNSNSPRNMNILGSNEYRETVYTPVAPFPVFSQVNNVGMNVGSSSLDNNGASGSSNGPVISGNSSLNQFPLFHLSSNKNSNPQSGRMDVNLSTTNYFNNVYRGVKLGNNVQKHAYRLVKPTMRTNVGNRVTNNVNQKENRSVRDENQNLKKVYVSKMYQLLADSSQFPPLPKEISVNEVEFLMRSKINSDQNKPNSNVHCRDDETNVNLVKKSKLVKGMELDSINRGTFCTVYKAKHGDDIVAVKCPQRKIHDSDPLMSRYRCYIEWKLLYRCNRHPNILNLIGGIRINEYEIWLVTEYIKTGDLFKLIHGNSNRSKVFRDSVEYRFKVMYQLADSIRFLHSLTPKIVHKDLKSNNILIDENYNIRICDFGDAEELHYNVITCCTAVTWQYAPPEIVGCSDPAKPNSNATEKVDVWSMGCIFLEILSKKTPLQHILDNIDDNCKHSTLYNLVNTNRIEHELKIPPLPDALYNLITMCLRPNPEVRATSVEVFEYLVNNETKILKQLSYINQYKINNVKF